MIGVSVIELSESYHQELISILTEKHFEMAKLDGFIKGEIYLSDDHNRIISFTYWVSQEARKNAFKNKKIRQAISKILDSSENFLIEDFRLIKTTTKAD